MSLLSSCGFEKAVSFLSPKLCDMLSCISGDIQGSVREIRLRAARPLVLITDNDSLFLTPNGRVSRIYTQSAYVVPLCEITESFKRLCGYSVHSNAQHIAEGFITLEGGHRAGICGSAVLSDGYVSSVRDINGINLRIAGQFLGCSDKIYGCLAAQGFPSAIIAGPPASGKTTVLRDLARQLSDLSRTESQRVTIADERGEIAAVHRGTVQNDVGFCDVLTGYPKATGIMIAVRTLSPQIIICDEVGDSGEVKAICEGFNTGVKFIVSAHLDKKEELFHRPALRELVKSGAFSMLVMLKGAASPGEIDGIYDIKELENEGVGRFDNNDDLCRIGAAAVAQARDACQTA